MLPKTVTDGKIIKVVDDEGNKRYDFQFTNKRGFKTTGVVLHINLIPNSGIMRSFYFRRVALRNAHRSGGEISIRITTSQRVDQHLKVGVERSLKKYSPMEQKSVSKLVQAADRNRWFIRKDV